MLKPIKDFTDAEKAKLCLTRKKRCEMDGYNKCIGCPAAIQYGHEQLTLCYFIAAATVKRNDYNEADDGSVDDADIPYWCK